jgi:succinoglycan biosynthesis transport protein ExoP
MSKIEQSIQEAIRRRDQSLPARRPEPMPPDVAPILFDENERQAHLKDYIDILLRRRWIVIVFLVTVVVTVTIFSFTMTPVYKASTSIQLKGGKTELVEYKEVYSQQSALETEYNILKSKVLAKRVAARFPSETIEENSDTTYLSILKNSVLNLLHYQQEKPVDFADDESYEITGANADDKIDENNAENQQGHVSVGTILRGVDIQPIKNTDIVQINFVSPDPEFAMNVANAYAEEYFNFTHESKLNPTIEGEIRLRKQVEDMRLKLEVSEKELHEFVGNSKYIVSSSDKGYENLLTNKFSILTKELDTAVSDRIEKETLYKEVKKSGVDYKWGIQNPIIQPLIKKQIELESKYAELLMIHKPEYPKMRILREQIDNVKEQIKKEEQAIVDSLKSEYFQALNKENTLSNITEEIRKEMTQFQNSLSEFLRMQREVKSNREIYDSLLKRLKEVEINIALEKNDVQILDRAGTPTEPFKPNKGFNFVLSMILGLLGGSCLAFFVEYFDDSIKTDTDIEKSAQIPVFGSVPLLKERPRDIVSLDLNENIAFSDALRSIGTRIHFANIGNQPKHIMITSPMEREGKSLISASIAISLMTTHGKGLIIDTDLRRPDIHHLFNLDNSEGLSTFLSGTIQFEDLIKESPYPRLDVITSGPVPPNPSELLYSIKMRELVDALSITYDYIIFDSAPILGISDSLILSTVCAGVILVARAMKTPKEALLKSRKALLSVNANTIGAVLNGVNVNAKLHQSSSYYSTSSNGKGKNKKLVQ